MGMSRAARGAAGNGDASGARGERLRACGCGRFRCPCRGECRRRVRIRGQRYCTPCHNDAARASRHRRKALINDLLRRAGIRISARLRNVGDAVREGRAISLKEEG